MTSTDPRDPSLQSLEALRGILATYVLLGHARWLLWAGHAVWLASNPPFWQYPLAYGGAVFRFGREAVLVFFALSGFFIHLSYATSERADASRFSATTFYRRRAHRLLAPYVFALVVTVVCDVIGRGWSPALYTGHTGDALLDATMARSDYSAQSVIPALLMLPSSLEHHFGSNGPLWSLAYEVVYYAVYPAWLWLRVRNWPLAMVGVPAGCLTASALIPHPFLASVTAFYPVWLGGAWLAESARALRGETARICAAAAAVVSFGAYMFVPLVMLKVVAATIFACAIVFLFATGPLMPGAPTRWLSLLGTRSFSIYILHFPIIALIAALQFRLLGARPLSGWLAVTGAMAAIALSCAGFAVCERHFLHRRQLIAAEPTR